MNKLLLVLVIGVAVPLLYFGAYVVSANVVIQSRTEPIFGHKRVGRVEFMVEYPYGSELTETIFAPAHWIDRKLRPGFWSVTYERDSG